MNEIFAEKCDNLDDNFLRPVLPFAFLSGSPMCGIVGAVSTRNIVPILVQGLQRLEYRGYDSCGVAVYADGLKRARSTSRVAELAEQVSSGKLEGTDLGIAHTRWATHGAPAVHNAHPHFSHGPGASTHTSGPAALRWCTTASSKTTTSCARAQAKGYVFVSQTDTEVIAHLVDSLYDGDLFEAVQAAVGQLHGAYAIAVFCKDEPHRLIGARAGSPLILGVGKDGQEHFLASDAMALAGVTDQIVYLEEGDLVDVQLGKYWLVDKAHKPWHRRSARSKRCWPTAARPSWARIATTCRRKFLSSRAPLPTRWKVWKALPPSCLTSR
jgi:glucosamine--fructose-6-phosphate aminotransferase (isomerizing)